jgi:hypothetical protein
VSGRRTSAPTAHPKRIRGKESGRAGNDRVHGQRTLQMAAAESRTASGSRPVAGRGPTNGGGAETEQPSPPPSPLDDKGEGDGGIHASDAACRPTMETDGDGARLIEARLHRRERTSRPRCRNRGKLFAPTQDRDGAVGRPAPNGDDRRSQTTATAECAVGPRKWIRGKSLAPNTGFVRGS